MQVIESLLQPKFLFHLSSQPNVVYLGVIYIWVWGKDSKTKNIYLVIKELIVLLQDFRTSKSHPFNYLNLNIFLFYNLNFIFILQFKLTSDPLFRMAMSYFPQILLKFDSKSVLFWYFSFFSYKQEMNKSFLQRNYK